VKIGLSSNVSKWWGGPGFTNPVCEMDVRPGGLWRQVMRFPEAEIPISKLAPHSSLEIKVARRFVVSRGFKTDERCDYEGRIISSLPAKNVRRIVRFPEATAMHGTPRRRLRVLRDIVN
jgi:uncharacterized protein YndB with AHSA1/START domain